MDKDQMTKVVIVTENVAYFLDSIKKVLLTLD